MTKGLGVALAKSITIRGWNHQTIREATRGSRPEVLRFLNEMRVRQPRSDLKTKIHLQPEPLPAGPAPRRAAGFTLAEVVIAVAIIAAVFSTILLAYNQATWRAEWSGYSLAAQSLATQQMEQARAAVWDPSLMSGSGVAVNELTNLTMLGRTASGGVVKGYTTGVLDLPISTNAGPVTATNFISIRTVSPVFGGTAFATSPVQMVKVDTVWRFRIGNTNRLYTNSVSTYFAPDNRDAETL